MGNVIRVARAPVEWFECPLGRFHDELVIGENDEYK